MLLWPQGPPKPWSSAHKMEMLLESMLEQRKMHITRLVANGDARVTKKSDERYAVLYNLQFTEPDMRCIMNAWQLNVDTWMKPENIGTLKKHEHMWLRHLCGCKFLLRQLIALPILCPKAGVNDWVLSELSKNWATFKDTPDHKKAVQRSQKSTQDKLSIHLYEAQAWNKLGFKLSLKVQSEVVNWWHDLSYTVREAAQDFESRRSAKRLDLLLKEKEKTQPYRGAGCMLLSAETIPAYAVVLVRVASAEQPVCR